MAGPGSVPAWTGVHSPPAINLVVTLRVLTLGAVAFVSGIRHKFPRRGSFLGHTRFCNYFMITIYSIQAHYLTWTWQRLIAIGLFAVPAWLALHWGLMPIRNRIGFRVIADGPAASIPANANGRNVGPVAALPRRRSRPRPGKLKK